MYMVQDDLRIFLLLRITFQLGIHNAYIRQKILAALESNMETPAAKVFDATPSAPMANDVPSAPPAPIETFQSNECVICMENKVLMLSSSLFTFPFSRLCAVPSIQSLGFCKFLIRTSTTFGYNV